MYAFSKQDGLLELLVCGDNKQIWKRTKYHQMTNNLFWNIHKFQKYLFFFLAYLILYLYIKEIKLFVHCPMYSDRETRAGKLFLKRQIINILGSAGRKVSVTAAQLCSYSIKAPQTMQ